MQKHALSLLLFLLLSFVAFSQAPNSIPYQAVIRNSSGVLIANQIVKLRLSLHDSIASGTIIYQETQFPNTNTMGMINIYVGKGTPAAGNFANINWSNNSKFLQVEIDVTGGTNYTDLGTQQLMSVPYALYSNKADSSKYASNGLPGNSTSGDMMYYNGTTWVKLAAGGYGQSLVMCDGVPAWGGCVPKVATGSSSAVSYTSLTTGGNVIAEGGFPVSSRGVCWSTSPNPTVALTTKTNDGAGIGNFTSSITGLTPNTTYYVRAYATNSVGSGYGADSTFTSRAITPPTVSTDTISSISNTTANGGGNVTNDGGATITSRGVCWSKSPNPTVALITKTTDGSGTGTFTSSITGLTLGTTYYVRAYAINSVGTSYGAQQTFTTTANFANLSSVTIGTQIWSSKNLDVRTYRNGDTIPQVTNATQWANLTSGAWCWYNNDSATYSSTYGRLYNCYAVTDPRGFAPLGWHVPSDQEWTLLGNYLGGNSVAGGYMKNTSGWTTPNFGATNSSGFAGLPGGYRTSYGTFTGFGKNGFWWTTSLYYPTNAWYRILSYANSILDLGYANYEIGSGFSVRVVRD